MTSAAGRALALLAAGCAALAPAAPANAAGQRPALTAPAAVVLRAPVPIVLPQPPPVVNPASGTLYDALLAIERARAVNPQAAQNAAFAYVGAVQQYRSGNFAAARISALQALSIAGTAQVPVVTGPALPAPAIDADSFLALARGTLDDCAARHDHRLSGARAKLAQAEHDFASRDWQATRRDAKAAIDACAVPRP
jgi:hypothetical protein